MGAAHRRPKANVRQTAEVSAVRVLILCTGNFGPQSIAEGLLRRDAGNVYEVFQRGINPIHVRPEAIAVMREEKP